MVRSYLIENRIRFDSDSGSGGGGAGEGKPDRFNPSEMRAREQRFQDRTVTDAPKGSDEARDKFASLFNDPTNETAAAITRSEDRALQAQAREGVMNQGSDRGLTMQDMAPINNPVQNDIARQRLAEQLAVAQAYQAPARQPGMMGILGYNTPKVALDTIQSQAGQFMMPRISTALENPTFSPVYGANNRVTGAADQFGNLIEGTDPMNSLGLMDGGGSDGDQMASIMPPVDDGSGGDGGDSGIGEIPSDELAIDYLQNPYYAYSGFGNQFSPYGYASGTLVDLLQTRGMTQPQQADTLGLFANPRDFR
jgi:hypothetical protein